MACYFQFQGDLLPKKANKQSAESPFFLSTTAKYHTRQIIQDAPITIGIQEGFYKGFLLIGGIATTH